ncbi:AAA family ATPase [Alkalibacillus silvisoli]|uniref:Rad50/SbcC-type AAA domain-containing protein n=1 Tax=Alkalibacillus silvisoli TaxID=392823 RepID=A0ABN0ZLW4_9BACI
MKNTGNIQFNKPVTLLVGENDTGKSTLLEGIAASAESILIDGESVESLAFEELKNK